MELEELWGGWECDWGGGGTVWVGGCCREDAEADVEVGMELD